MAWYRSGTVSVTNGSVTVNGAGTAWIAGAKIGEGFKGPDGQVYEIASINADTQLTLASVYLGGTAAGVGYVIVPTQSYLRDLSKQASQLINQFGAVVDGAGAGRFAFGSWTAPSVRAVGDEDTGLNFTGGNNAQIVGGGQQVAAWNNLGFNVLKLNGTAVNNSASQGAVQQVGDIGSATADWVSRETVVQQDAPTPGSTYTGLRWTYWGNRHLGAIEATLGSVDYTGDRLTMRMTGGSLTLTGGGNLRLGTGAGVTVAEIDATGTAILAGARGVSDNVSSLGASSMRWAGIYLGSNPIVTSDERVKIERRETELGLDFIMRLAPISYRLADARSNTETADDGFETVQETVYEDVQVQTETVVVEDGVAILKQVTRTERRQVIDQIPVVDEQGRAVMSTQAAVLDAEGNVLTPSRQVQLTHAVPRTQAVQRPKTRQVTSLSAGVRRHHGLSAQQVGQVLQDMGLSNTDFAGLIRDEDADTWGLRYEQFVAPLVLAVQQLQQRVLALEGNATGE